MSTQFRFTVPSLPKEIWSKFQDIRRAHGLTQKQCLIMAVLAICDLGAANPERVADLVEKVTKEAWNEPEPAPVEKSEHDYVQAEKDNEP